MDRRAAVLARVLKRTYCEIRLIDVPGPDTDVSSEATNPAFQRLRSLLGIDEADLVRETGATFNLARNSGIGARSEIAISIPLARLEPGSKLCRSITIG